MNIQRYALDELKWAIDIDPPHTILIVNYDTSLDSFLGSLPTIDYLIADDSDDDTILLDFLHGSVPTHTVRVLQYRYSMPSESLFDASQTIFDYEFFYQHLITERLEDQLGGINK